jgi:hypothetical protein
MLSAGITETEYLLPEVHDIGLTFPLGASRLCSIPGDAIEFGKLSSRKRGGPASDAELFKQASPSAS